MVAERLDESSGQELQNNNISCNVIVTISPHIKNPDIVRTVYSGILRDIKVY